jgi:cell division protein ZapA (FtsZ GTPase activity inhibitor)
MLSTYNIKEMLNEITDGINVDIDDLREQSSSTHALTIVFLRNVRQKVQNIKEFINTEDLMEKHRMDLKGMENELQRLRGEVNRANGKVLLNTVGLNFDFKAISRLALMEIRLGKKIFAIKQVRNDFNMGLKEAKDYVEAFCAKYPELENQGIGRGQETEDAYFERARDLICIREKDKASNADIPF